MGALPRHVWNVIKAICAALIAVLIAVFPCWALEKAELVIVKKSEARLYLKRGERIIASFHVAFGGDPSGHKQQEGDERTPEGRYLLDSKNNASRFYKSIHISYPNNSDIAKARTRGVLPGGQIIIHGQKNGFGWLSPITQRFNWTDGCIALSNEDMDTVWNTVDVGTPIEIVP